MPKARKGEMFCGMVIFSFPCSFFKFFQYFLLNQSKISIVHLEMQLLLDLLEKVLKLAMIGFQWHILLLKK